MPWMTTTLSLQHHQPRLRRQHTTDTPLSTNCWTSTSRSHHCARHRCQHHQQFSINHRMCMQPADSQLVRWPHSTSRRHHSSGRPPGSRHGGMLPLEHRYLGRHQQRWNHHDDMSLSRHNSQLQHMMARRIRGHGSHAYNKSPTYTVCQRHNKPATRPII